MLFKNLVFHRLPANWELSAGDFENQLAGRTLKPCGPFDMSTRGWVPVTSGGRLLHTVNRRHMVALGVDENGVGRLRWAYPLFKGDVLTPRIAALKRHVF